jgi:hypothetical protein
MSFEDMKFDLSPHTSPQGLGRCLTTLTGLKLVDRYLNWQGDDAASITRAGEEELRNGHRRQ